MRGLAGVLRRTNGLARATAAWDAPTVSAPTAVAEREPETHPLLDANGQPIGLRRYCELVTPGWRWDWNHLRYVDRVLDAVTAGDLTRVIIEWPPRHGKTQKATVRYPAYRLELDPMLPVIVAAYSGKTAQKFSRMIRRIARDRIELSTDRNAASDWETTAGGGVRAAGVGEGIAGLPGKLILIDDPIAKFEEADSLAYRDRVWEWYLEDVYTRLEPGGAIVVTMTRRHEDDLIGRILASEDGDAWTVIRLPALAEADDPIGRDEGEALCRDRYDEKALARIRKVLGERRFACLYQQRPAPAEGHIFKTEWLRYYTTRDHPIDGVPFLPYTFTSHLQSWDMSFKDKNDSNPVSGQFWSRLGADCYLRDRRHGQMDFTASIGAVLGMTGAHPEAMLKLVEDKANGPAIISTLRSKVQGLVAVEPEGDKVSRAYSVTPMMEAGQVWFPHPAIAPWVEAVKLELVHFPFGANDDDVDSMTQALRRFEMQIRHGISDLGTGAQQERSAAARIAEQFAPSTPMPPRF